MPVHDYQCKLCGTVQEDVFHLRTEPVCCGETMDRLVCAPRPVIFHEGIYEHITGEPLYITSRKQLKQVCKEHNCTSDYAEM